MRVSDYELFLVLAACTVAALGIDLVAAASLVVLWIGWRLLVGSDRMYVLPVAFAFHWMQTSVGMFYSAMTGRTLRTIESSDYQPMVWIGLGCVLALAIGLRIGTGLIAAPDRRSRPDEAFPFQLLLMLYVGAIVCESTALAFTQQFPSLRQFIVTTVDSARLGLLFLVLRRLNRPTPRWFFLSAVVLFEIVMGLTGYFAGFRDPIVLFAIALLEIFDTRQPRHWLVLAGGGAVAFAVALAWMGIRVDYRRDFDELDQFRSSTHARIERLQTLSSDWLKRDADSIWVTADNLVDRLWAVYYPALALQRVPSALPHTHGTILWAAVQHIVTPRVLFPDKEELPSDSDMVRKYSNLWVAGRESNTTIAFGYAAEAYIDFGVPLMFVPVFVYGLCMGLAYAFFRKTIWYNELFVGFTTVSFWLSLYLFERSWATLLGVSLGFMVYLGIPVILLDRILIVRFYRDRDNLEHRRREIGLDPILP